MQLDNSLSDPAYRRKTKIVCTLGPSTDDEEVLAEMMRSGMNVARINFSHSNYAEHKLKVEEVKRLRERLGLHIALLLDTKGPEIRFGNFEGGSVDLHEGQAFTLVCGQPELPGNAERAPVSFADLYKDVSRGVMILADDGLIELQVDEVRAASKEIVCRVLNNGPLSDHKSLNVPGVDLSIPFMSEHDRADLAFGVEQGFDFVAASFTQSAENILQIHDELHSHGCDNMRIIAKIENRRGVENIDEILRVSDGVMVARGDMGVEIPLEEVPIIQKMLIFKCYNAGKQVITATQMLESMVTNPRPTRAETTDVANAIYDGTSAIMLSAETTVGKYPVEAVRMMDKIAVKAEHAINYKERFHKRDVTENPDVTNAIAHATVTTAHDLNASAIITVTKRGSTARMLSKFRPQTPIIGCATDGMTCRQLNMSWGITPLLIDEKQQTGELFTYAVNCAHESGLVNYGELVVITAGIPLGISGTTNLLKVHLVGDVLVEGVGIVKKNACAHLCVCQTEAELAERFHPGDIIVMPCTSNESLQYIKQASGIVTEADGANSHAAVVGLALDIPVIVGALNATVILKSGALVTLDGVHGTVFPGELAGQITNNK